MKRILVKAPIQMTVEESELLQRKLLSLAREIRRVYPSGPHLDILDRVERDVAERSGGKTLVNCCIN